MQRFLAASSVAVAALCCCAANAVDVLTSRNNAARTGVNAQERKLTPAKVNAGNFGKLWTLYADGQVVAQPLYLAGLPIDTSANRNIPLVQGTFNAVVIATMHNTVYVYDADKERPGPDGRTVPLWATWLGKSRPSGKDIDMYSTNDPEWGILATPVMSPDRSTLYVVAWHDDGPGGFQFRLHALDMKDGTHRRPPVPVGPSSIDTTACAGQSDINPCRHKQRAALLLSGGMLYVGFGGDGSRGALVAFEASTLTRRAVWRSTPTGKDGGIWQSGQGPSADADGNVYLMTGNGTFDADRGGRNYGDSFVKLKLEDGELVVKDFFTPCNQAFLNEKDLDLGSAGPLLVPDTPPRIVGGGKEGVLYVLSPNDMGKYAASPTAPNCQNPNAIQEVAAFPPVHDHGAQVHWGNIHGSPVFWKGPTTGHIYAWGENSPLKGYKFSNGQLQDIQAPKRSRFTPPLGMPGGMLSLSADGAKAGTGIVWALVPLNGDANEQRGVKALLLALDAEDVSRTLWTSEEAGERDRVGLFAKFTPPTVAGGKVFVPTYGDDEPLRRYKDDRPAAFPRNYYVAVYGERPGPPPPRRIVNQDRDDVAVVVAAAGPLSLSVAACRPIDMGTVDCTDALARTTDRPSFHRVLFSANQDISGCALLRVTTVSKGTGLANSTGIGFWSTQALAGNQAAENAGRFVPKAELKQVGTATLKSGAPATLHEFVGVANCPSGADRLSRLFKPYMEFEAPADLTLFHNWDLAPNYEIGRTVTRIDRSADVLGP
jgi:outer membrane protein assembly factor BamB